MKKLTLQDIADELGVSKGTVDRAIHNRPDINIKTKEMVLKYIKEHNYTPDKIASSLSKKQKKTKLGIILPKTPDFFWSHVKKGAMAAESELKDYNLEVIYKELFTREQEELLDKVDELIGEKIDALALVPINTPKISDMINDMKERGIPAVTINDDVVNSNRIFYVGPQMKQSGRAAGELMGRFLNGAGKVIVFNVSYGKTESIAYKERMLGFLEIMKESFKNIEVIETHSCRIEKLEEDLSLTLNQAFKEKEEISGIYDVDGLTLSYIGDYVKNNDLRDITVVGHETWSKVEELMLEGHIQACICQDPYSQGYYAIKLLHEYMEYRQKPEYDRMLTRIDIFIKENLLLQKNVINPYFNINR